MSISATSRFVSALFPVLPFARVWPFPSSDSFGMPDLAHMAYCYGSLVSQSFGAGDVFTTITAVRYSAYGIS